MKPRKTYSPDTRPPLVLNAWHIVRCTKKMHIPKLSHKRKRETVTVGMECYEPVAIICRKGLHASRSIMCAWRSFSHQVLGMFPPSNQSHEFVYVCRVVCSKPTFECKKEPSYGKGKFVCHRRKVLWMVKVPIRRLIELDPRSVGYTSQPDPRANEILKGLKRIKA